MDNTRVVDIQVDASVTTGQLPHNWNYIGYDEINYTYTPEGQALLAKFNDLQSEPYYVRVHHLLCTGNCHGFYKWGSTNAYLERDGEPVYDWEIVDLVFDTLLKHKAKPFVELGFMPQQLADSACYQIDGDNPDKHYQDYGFACPPADYQKWYDLIFQLVQHCRERYGDDEIQTWYWELWNEPDLNYYWKGSIEEFNKLYDYTVAAVKDAFPAARVGGPGTTNPRADGYSGQFLDDFLNHCANGTNAVTGETGTALDFVTFHVKGGGYRRDFLHEKQMPPSIKRMVEDVQTGYGIIAKYPEFTGLECILSEIDPDGWAAGGAWDNANLNFRNTAYYPSFVATVFDKLTEFAQSKNWDLRFLSWAFLFVGERCFEGTRTFSTQGIDKAIFNLFRMYGKLGDNRLSFQSSSTLNPLNYDDMWGLESESDVSGFATFDDNGLLSILIYNHHDDWDRTSEVQINLDIQNMPFTANDVTVQHYRIDEHHSNAYSEWLNQGKPMYPDNEQYEAIKSKDKLEHLQKPQNISLENESLNLAFTIPVHAISLIQISKKG